MLLEEIRINPKYSSIYESDYGFDGDQIKDSEPVIRTRMLTTKKYLKKLTGNAGREQILPPNTRFHEKFTNGDIFVVEEPPSFRTIMIDVDMWGIYHRLKADGKIEEYEIENYLEENSRPYRFTLAFPYTIFVLVISSAGYGMCTNVFFRTQPLIGLSDHILLAPLYNIPETQRICLGSAGSNNYTSATAVAINLMNVFWGATFSPDYSHNVQQYSNVPGLCDYFTWQHLSKTNPMFIYNAHWKKYGENLFTFIEKLKREYSLSKSFEIISYKAIKSAFIDPEPTNTEKEVGGGRHTYRLYDNISNGIFVKNNEQLNIGDSFLLANGKPAIVESFLGNRDGDMISHMNIITEDQRKLLRLTPMFKKFIYDRLMEERYVSEATIQDGQILKPNDIIKVRNRMGVSIFKKVKYIRKALDDQLEILMGTDYYLASSIKSIEKLHIEEAKIGDYILKKDDQYFIYNNRHRPQPYREASIGTYEGLDVNDNGRILGRFKVDTNGIRDHMNIQINTDQSVNTSTRLVQFESSTRQLPSTFRLGRKVWTSYDEHGLLSDKDVWATPDGVVYKLGTYCESPGVTIAFEQFVENDKFTSESFDYDEEFTIGDLVVVSNWNDPNDMLSVKSIEGFNLSSYEGPDGREYKRIDFVLKKKDGSLTSVEYVSQEKIIYSGRIRKVVTKLNDLEVGMKIIAKESGISNFPKKDTNIIVAFVVDGGHEPLVLCSNACTLWISDVEEKFDIIPKDSDQWGTLQHAPIEIDKVKFQPGDLITSNGRDYRNSQGYTVFRNHENKGLRAHPNEYYHNSPEGYTMDSYFRSSMKFDCILLPRLTQKQQDDLGVIGAYPNFYGGFTPSINARLYFLNEGRTIINV